MKKVLKISLIIIGILILSAPIVCYSAIVITNNCIADSIEKDLKNYALPSDTKIIETTSIAGKFSGNGNGMQYAGIILVESSLSKEELQKHYEKSFEYVEVRNQTSQKLDFELNEYSFRKFNKIESGSAYSIVCYDTNGTIYDNDTLKTILNLDLRGH